MISTFLLFSVDLLNHRDMYKRTIWSHKCYSTQSILEMLIDINLMINPLIV